VAESIVTLRVDTSQATRALKGVQNQTNTLQRAFGGLKTALVGVGFTALAKQTVFASANFEKLQTRLKLLTEENGTFRDSLNLAAEAERKFGLSATDALEAVTNLQARLGPLGTSMEDVATIFNGFNTAAILSGASTQEQAGAMRQLTQALGSGVLRGDEFNSIAEQMSVVLAPVAEILGVEVGQLRDMAAQGKITGDVMVKAFKKIEEGGSEMLKQLMADDPTMVFKILNNELEKLSIAVGDLLGPVVLDATVLLTRFVRALADFADSEAGQVTAIVAGLALGVKGLTAAFALVSAKVIALKASFATMSMAAMAANGSLGMTTTMAFATAGGFAKATAAANAFKIALAKTGIGVAVIAFSSLAVEIMKTVNQQKELNRLFKEGTVAELNAKIAETEDKIADLNEKAKKTNIVFDILSDIFAHGAGSSMMLNHHVEVLTKRLDKLNKRLKDAQAEEITKSFEAQKKALEDQATKLQNRNELLLVANEEKRKEAELEQEIAAMKEKFEGDEAKELERLMRNNFELERKADKIKEANDAAKKLAETFEKIGDSIATGVSDALVDAVMQTKSLAESAKALLNDIARQFLRLGINTALFSAFGGAEGIFKNLPTFAAGGRPTVGQAALVGEKGPELFVPSVAGTVIPNNKLGGGGAVTVNVSVDATGSNVEGDEEEGRELGRLIAAAVQSEIVQQKRAGGLLA